MLIDILILGYMVGILIVFFFIEDADNKDQIEITDPKFMHVNVNIHFIFTLMALIWPLWILTIKIKRH